MNDHDYNHNHNKGSSSVLPSSSPLFFTIKTKSSNKNLKTPFSIHDANSNQSYLVKESPSSTISSTFTSSPSSSYYSHSYDYYDPFNLKQAENVNLLTSSSPYSSSQESSESGSESPTSLFFTKEGFIVNGNDVYHPNEYCVTRNAQETTHSSSTLIINFCIPQCQKSSSTKNHVTCINKCCPYGESIDYVTERCRDSGPQKWTLQNIYQLNQNNNNNKTDGLNQIPMHRTPSSSTTIHMTISHFPLNCPEHRYRIPHYNRDLYDEFGLLPQSVFRVLRNGSVLTFNDGVRKWFNIIKPANNIDNAKGDENFEESFLCLDGIQNFGHGLYYNGGLNDDIMIYCMELPTNQNKSTTDGSIRILLYFISSGLLITTAVIYYLIMIHDAKSSSSSSVHGWTILCQIVSMFLTYLFLATSRVFSLFNDLTLNKWPCILNGILSHFFTLSTFFWMTALDFDIWKTFRSINSCRQSKGRKSLIYYALFALGIPAIIIIFSLVLENLYKKGESLQLFSIISIPPPSYGKTTCYISREALGFYVYYIIGLLVSTNILLISLTFRNIYNARLSTQMILYKDKRNMKQQQSSFKLFSKLLIIMGISWLFDFISWLFYAQIQACQSSIVRHWIWFCFDLINICQPMVIFIIFICKRKTLVVLASRFRFIRKVKPNWANSSKKSNLSTKSSSAAVVYHNHNNSSRRSDKVNVNVNTSATTNANNSNNSNHSSKNKQGGKKLIYQNNLNQNQNLKYGEEEALVVLNSQQKEQDNVNGNGKSKKIANV